jgi:hypothetical protein
LSALKVEGEAKPITSESMYATLVPEKVEADRDSRGVNCLKEFHLKNPQIYDNELKSKVFFIGQNALKANDLGLCLDQQKSHSSAV